MSFTEIIHWVALTFALIGGAVYAVLAWGATSVDQVAGAMLVAVTVITIGVVVSAVAVGVPMSIRNRGGTLADQRDDAIEAGALPYTFSALIVGCVVAINDILSRNFQDRPYDPVVTLHLLLGSVFAAVVVGSIVTLYRYRVGIK